ncbi:hypothetical protein [Pedobacter xixiisoli]|uniref:hypothetical protein n=1 Tax=Pedobacter xixiisoli TaxID=1476464 RepID=UPI0015CBE3D8|nr:hypothetical protein [Pedobacter xixiisoli]
METATILASFLKLASRSKIFRQSHISLFSAILAAKARASKFDKFPGVQKGADEIFGYPFIYDLP